MATQKPVYQRSLFPQLAVPSQADVIAALQPHYPLLWETVMCPWEVFRTYRETDPNFIDLNEEEAGVWLTMQAAKRARRLFAGRAGFRISERHRKLVIVLEEKLSITIKKL